MQFYDSTLEANLQPKRNSTDRKKPRSLAALLTILALQAPDGVLAQRGEGAAGGRAVSAASGSKGSAAGGDAPVTLAHGSSAQLAAEKGQYIHRWVGEDGEPFEIANSQQREPSPAERLQIEKEFGERMQMLMNSTARYAKQLEAVNRALRTYQVQMSNSDK